MSNAQRSLILINELKRAYKSNITDYADIVICDGGSTDGSLEAMATIYPQTIEELQNIPGVGAGKAKRYGNSKNSKCSRH